MAGLRDLVQGLAARPEVDAVVVVSADGLPIDHAGGAEVDSEALAALATNFVAGARRLGQVVEVGGGGGMLSNSVLEFGNRLVVVRSLSGDNLLFILAKPANNIGPLLYDLRRQAPELASLL
jgi:predicted regulator of Ras-like GTPase activity (Roadblock/LC7/MglB family)